ASNRIETSPPELPGWMATPSAGSASFVSRPSTILSAPMKPLRVLFAGAALTTGLTPASRAISAPREISAIGSTRTSHARARQDTQAPPAQSPQETAQAKVQPGQSGVAPDVRDLDALTLQRALEIALVNNLGLKLEELTAESTFYLMRSTYGVFDWGLGARAG